MRKYILMNLAIAGLSGIFNGPVLSARDALKWARRWWKGDDEQRASSSG